MCTCVKVALPWGSLWVGTVGLWEGEIDSSTLGKLCIFIFALGLENDVAGPTYKPEIVTSTLCTSE